MGTDYELQTIIKSVITKHTKALEEEVQKVMNTFYISKRDELNKKVIKAQLDAYNDCYKFHTEEGLITLEELSEMSMSDISEKISTYNAESPVL